MLMVVMTPREKWTDERLDDLQEEMREGFADTKAEMREGFARIDKDIRELRGDVKELNARFDALNGRLIGGLVVMLAAIIGSNALF
jgi:hypothetical protein